MRFRRRVLRCQATDLAFSKRTGRPMITRSPEAMCRCVMRILPREDSCFLGRQPLVSVWFVREYVYDLLIDRVDDTEVGEPHRWCYRQGKEKDGRKRRDLPKPKSAPSLGEG